VVKTLENTKRNWDQAQSIGGVYAQKLIGREIQEQVIYYFSVGLGIQDAALAEFILANGKF
jgi:ornithine cyclodeaminase